MSFNSVIFICMFLPLVITGWFLLQRLSSPVFAKIFLVLMSLWYYGYANIRFVPILLISAFFNYLIAILLNKTGKGCLRKVLLLVGIIFNVGVLFYFKYLNFFIDNINFFFRTDIFFVKIALPLGISFYTFTLLSFIIDCYRDRSIKYSFLDFMVFLCFFPRLCEGPIARHDEFIPQLLERKNRYIKSDYLYEGVPLFILGLAKKVLLADNLSVLVNIEYENIQALDTPSSLLIIVFYMLELYFDFSGYTDMAIATSKMLGFKIPDNFDYPFEAVSIKDFWRRWHITLSKFLAEYIYYPLGGNRKGKARQCVNILIVFLISGIWHGANWTFIVWGLLMGIFQVFETIFPKATFKNTVLNRIKTFLLVTLTFSIFRSDSLSEALNLMKRIFTTGDNGFFVAMCNQFNISENFALLKLLNMLAPNLVNSFYVLCVLILTVVSFAFVIFERKIKKNLTAITVPRCIVLAVLFAWSFISLSNVTTFLYFNF